MVSSMGGNVKDDKGWDDNVISTVMESSSGNTEDVKMCKCVGVWKVMCKSVGVYKYWVMGKNGEVWKYRVMGNG